MSESFVDFCLVLLFMGIAPIYFICVSLVEVVAAIDRKTAATRGEDKE